MNSLLLYPIAIPILMGLFVLFVPRKVKFVKEALAIIGSAGTFGMSIWMFMNKPLEWVVNDSVIFKIDPLSGFIILAAGLFAFLITLYSIKFMQGSDYLSKYYGSLLCTMGAAVGALMANHLLVLLVFWGFLGITLYMLILTGGGKSGSAARKTLIIVGGSDALMLLSIITIYFMSSTFLLDKISLPFNNVLTYIAFIALALGAFAKAGAMPMHTWIPDVSETAPMTVTAYLPAALDKLLGIYLLARMCLGVFQMNMSMNLLLMIVGSVTIIAAVMMALIQHDMRKLLAYHAVSQVGYMVLGIGTGNPIGIAGGLFHMLNHSIYKACLFMTAGAVKQKTGTTDLDKLGGLGKLMPLTFISFLIAAFAISGIPPLNGFASKWMVYQGLVELGRSGDRLWIVWLIAALFGSGLTLASFMKLSHSVFLGIPSKSITSGKIKDVGFAMGFPMIVLALLCLVFGIFAYSIPMKYFLLPAVSGVVYSGVWSPGLATLLILVGLFLGFIIYLFGNMKGIRETNAFVGGEKIPVEKRVTGTGFYNTIRDSGGIGGFYKWAEAKRFDIYEQCVSLSHSIGRGLGKIHTGILSTYVLWLCAGFAILLILLMW